MREKRKKDILFSIVVVALNPGEKLEYTLESILTQEYDGYEILLKDGMSRDGSVEKAAETYGTDQRLRIFREKDKGIYDAMNQAIEKLKGDYILFLNCGDAFYDNKVLGDTANRIRAITSRQERPAIIYGDTYCMKTGAVVHSAPRITGFTCYRNIPCHQSCFYDARLFAEKRYELDYRIRADYDHFLWCYYRGEAQMAYLDRIVSSYEGGGYSESRENRGLDRREHRRITQAYMGRGELMGYRFLMALTLVPLRRLIAESGVLSGAYHKVKSVLYR